MKNKSRANVDHLLSVTERDGKDEAHTASILGQLGEEVKLRVTARPHLPEEDTDLVHRDGNSYPLPTGHLD